MHKRRKKYYIPGIVSLLGIPLILCYFINRQVNSRLHVIPVDWYNKQYWRATNNSIGMSLVPERKYLKLELTRNTDSSEIVLNFGEMLIRKIIAERDTLNAVNFVFHDDCKYETLVSALNICLINNVPCYFLSIDGLVMYYAAPYVVDTSTNNYQNTISCGTKPYM